MAMIPQYSTKLFTDIYVSADKFVADYTAKGMGGISDETLIVKLYYLLYAKYGNSPIANYDETQWKYKVMSTIFMYGPSWESRLGLQNKLRNMSEADMLTGAKQVTSGTHSGTSNNLRSATNKTTTTVDQDTSENGTVEDTKTGKNISNHANNPSTDPNSQTTDPLVYVDSQNTTHTNDTDNITNNKTGTNDSTTVADGSVQDTTTNTANTQDDTTTTYSIAKLNAYQQLWELIKTDVTSEFLDKFINLFKRFVKPERTWIYESEDGND